MNVQSAKSRKAFVIAVVLTVAVALLLPLLLSANGKALLIWVDKSPDDRYARFKEEFDRLDEHEKRAVEQRCQRSESLQIARDAFCNPESLHHFWIKSDPERATAYLQPCIYLYGYQTFREDRLSGTFVCGTLIAVEAQ